MNLIIAGIVAAVSIVLFSMGSLAIWTYVSPMIPIWATITINAVYALLLIRMFMRFGD